MEDKIRMSSGLLDLLVMVQDYRKFLLSEIMYKEAHDIPAEKDWFSKTQAFFNSIDNQILNKYGLCKNKISFDVVLGFIITPEMLATKYEELDKFECWTSCIPD